MKRTQLAVVAAALVLLVPTQAMACRTIKPKTWKGTIQLAAHATLASQDFILNGCKYHDTRLNGTDTLVFDVASHRGLKAAAKWTTTAPVNPSQVSGTFRTSSCGAINYAWTQASAGKSKAFTIPSSAKWMIVTAYTVTPAKDIAVTVSSPGRKC